MSGVAPPAKRQRTDSPASNVPKKNPFPFAQPVTEHHMVTMLRNLINTYTGATPNPSRASLPGPLPHTLTRSSLATLLKNDYWACEKSDGIRTMFLAHGGHAYLVDRCFDFYKLPVCKGVYASLSAQGDVLVDGEIVVSYFDPAVDGDEKQAVKTIKDFADVAAFEAAQKTSRVMFYMFDAVHFGGRSVKDEELTSRLRCLGELRNAQFVACEKLELPKAQLPLTLQTKTFCKSYECQSVRSRVHNVGNGGFVYYEQRKGFKSFNDGIIFTPAHNNYLHNKADMPPPLKYKWAGLHTVDFLLRKPFVRKGKGGADAVDLWTEANTLPSHGGGPAGTSLVLFRTIEPDAEQAARITALCGDRASAVAEFAYDVQRGTWVVKHLREDKTRPNFISTVASSMEAMAEALTLDDVVHKLLKAHNKLPPRKPQPEQK